MTVASDYGDCLGRNTARRTPLRTQLLARRKPSHIVSPFGPRASESEWSDCIIHSQERGKKLSVQQKQKKTNKTHKVCVAQASLEFPMELRTTLNSPVLALQGYATIPFIWCQRANSGLHACSLNIPPTGLHPRLKLSLLGSFIFQGSSLSSRSRSHLRSVT